MSARRWAVALTALIILAVALGAMFQSQSPSQPLGPADGHDLRPDDMDRVQVGTVAPDFTLESVDGGRLALSSFRGSKFVVLVFYRGHW